MATNKTSNRKPAGRPNPSVKKPAKKNLKPGKKPKKKRCLFFRIVRGLFLTLFILGLFATVVFGGYVFAIAKSTPTIDVEAILRLSEPSTLYDKDGTYMDTLHSEVNRTVISFDQMPQQLKDAYVSIEDQRFYDHNGIDIRRIAGSVYIDVKRLILRQSGVHGGSTITQQLLKNTILSDEDTKLERKVKEIFLATNLETKLSKDQILTQYLNTIPVGGVYFGVEEGAKYYFGKDAKDLSLIECAYLAGVTQAPTTYNAYTDKNKADPTVYRNRTKTVLSKMKELNKITSDQYNQAISDIDNGKLVFTNAAAQSNNTLKYEYYIDPALSQVREDLKTKYKYTDDEVSKMFANGGLKIYTNMDKTLQDSVQGILDQTTVSAEKQKPNQIVNGTSYAFQASATVVDYKAGKVLAMVGGRGPQVAQGLNRAYDGRRSIGSGTKPLTVYGPAINEKLFTAASIIDDTPYTFSGGYTPHNDGGENDNSGNITLREGLRQSKNIVACKIEDKIGIKTGLLYGEKFGLKYDDSSKNLPGLALGQFTVSSSNPDGGNTYLMASSYGVFGNGGQYSKPKLYSTVKDSTGKTILDADHTEEQIFSEQAAYIMYDMLKGSMGFTGSNAKWGDMPVAGKTGTTSDSKDLWFNGLTPYLSASVWLGYDYPDTMYANSNTAAGVWGQIMAKASQGMSTNTDVEMPSTGLVQKSISKSSGKLATAYSDAFMEYFIEGTEPQSYSDTDVAPQPSTATQPNTTAPPNTPATVSGQPQTQVPENNGNTVNNGNAVNNGNTNNNGNAANNGNATNNGNTTNSGNLPANTR